MEIIKKNKKTKKTKRDNFGIIFVAISIFMFLLLIFCVQWLRSSLFEAKDQAASEFVQDYKENLVNEGVDPFVGIKNSAQEGEILKPIDDGSDPFLGSEDAKVKIFYFSDFSCPFCSEKEEIVKNIYNKFSKDVRIIWKDYPDLKSLESFSYQAAKAARCANEQGRFWDYNKMLYSEEANFTQQKGELFINLAERLKLNVGNFTTCINNIRNDRAIMENVSEAEDLGIVAIPYIYINDTDMLVDFSEQELQTMVEQELNK